VQRRVEERMGGGEQRASRGQKAGVTLSWCVQRKEGEHKGDGKKTAKMPKVINGGERQKNGKNGRSKNNEWKTRQLRAPDVWDVCRTVDKREKRASEKKKEDKIRTTDKPGGIFQRPCSSGSESYYQRNEKRGEI